MATPIWVFFALILLKSRISNTFLYLKAHNYYMKLTPQMKRKIERDEKRIKEIIGDRKIFKRFWGADIESILDDMNKRA